jgi:quercetin dioxygenase-like cupin family protein
VKGYRALTVAEVEGVAWPGGLTWHPIRMELGLHAFGAGAFSGGPGALVVEPHTESGDGRGHEELYIVLSGRATFTLDGEPLDAPAGTLVFVADPDVHRQAVAAEAGTTVLALGGPPTFEVSGWEWLMRAKPLMAGDPERARAILADGLRELPGSAAIPYGFALLEAAQDNPVDAALSLREAFTREPRLRAEAASEPTLAALLKT